MARFRVVVSKIARRQARAIASWWERNRLAAPALFKHEFGQAVQQLREAPFLALLGEIERPGIRRILLAKTRYHLYFRINEGESRVEITRGMALIERLSATVGLSNLPSLVNLPPHQPINLTTQNIHELQHLLSGVIRNIPPSYRNPNARLRFIQRAARGFKPKPRVASGD